MGLASRIKNIFRNTNAAMAFYNLKTTGRFFGKVKDKIPTLNRAEVVYNVTCSCNQTYIGQTKQYLKSRIDQHKYDIRKFQRRTGLSQHVIDNGHQVDWESVRVMKNESNDMKRCFYEMANIIREPNSLNIQADFIKFDGGYEGIIKRFP